MRDDPLDVRCSFCCKRQDEVRKLIAGPTVYICNECIELCIDVLTEELEGWHYARPSRPTRVDCCSFCGKARQEVRKLIAGPTVWICNECIDLCNDVILGEEAEP